MISKDKKENIALRLNKENIDELISKYLADNSGEDAIDEINGLLASFFTHQDRSDLIYDARKIGDTVYSVTNTITFLVKLNEYWRQYKVLVQLPSTE